MTFDHAQGCRISHGSIRTAYWRDRCSGWCQCRRRALLREALRASRTEGGFRLFTPETVERVRFIKQAQEIGLSLEEIGTLLAIGGAGELLCPKSRNPTLEQAVLADFISEGHFARHICRMRALYAERQQTLLKAGRAELDGLLDLRQSDTGMHLIGWLPDGVDDQAASRAASAVGVEVTPLSAYTIKYQNSGALRLGYTGYKPREIWRATRRLAVALKNMR